MEALTLVTCQAHNTVPITRVLSAYLSERLGRPMRFLENEPWQTAYAGVAAGRYDVAWICGRPYVQLFDSGAPIELLAAPVMAGERYGDRPIYFSDVVVRRDSPFERFEDLSGASWAYNEPGSQSGYHITCYSLACRGETERFFGRVVGSGAHVRSLAMVLDGEIDASAIDSTVLEWEITHDPTLAERLRVIASLGPSPIPPLVVSRRGRTLLADLREALLDLERTAEGRTVLATGRLARFAAVTDEDYAPIRDMAKIAAGIELDPHR